MSFGIPNGDADIKPGLEEAKVFLAERYELPQDASWTDLLKAERQKLDFAQKYRVLQEGVVPVAAPEFLRGLLFKSIWRTLDDIVRRDRYPELHDALFQRKENHLFPHYPALDFNAFRRTLEQVYGEGMTFDQVNVLKSKNNFEWIRAHLSLPPDCSLDEVMVAHKESLHSRKVGGKVRLKNASHVGSGVWTNDLDYGVSANAVMKWDAIKQLYYSFENILDDSPLVDFIPLVEYFENLKQGDIPSNLDRRDPEKVRQVMEMLEGVSWETIFTEQDRSRRNAHVRYWPLERNASWDNILKMFEQAYQDACDGKEPFDVEDLNSPRDHHVEVVRTIENVRRLLAQKFPQIPDRQGSLLLFQLARVHMEEGNLLDPV